MAFITGSTLLDAIVLSVAAREGTYGYKITQDVRGVMEVSESTLYPVLRRLQKDGCLTTYDQAFAGRNRRYYKSTPAGSQRLNETLAEWEEYKQKIDRVFYGGNET